MKEDVMASLKLALVVGSILILINQLDVIMFGLWTPILVAKVATTPLVPFLVSLYSRRKARRSFEKHLAQKSKEKVSQKNQMAA